MDARQASTAPGDAPPLGRGLHALWASPAPTAHQPHPQGQAGACEDPMPEDAPWDVIIIGTG